MKENVRVTCSFIVCNNLLLTTGFLGELWLIYEFSRLMLDECKQGAFQYKLRF